MIADPEPDNRVMFKPTQGTVMQPNSDEIDGIYWVHALKAQWTVVE
jgi:hypothetical protein